MGLTSWLHLGGTLRRIDLVAVDKRWLRIEQYQRPGHYRPLLEELIKVNRNAWSSGPEYAIASIEPILKPQAGKCS